MKRITACFYRAVCISGKLTAPACYPGSAPGAFMHFYQFIAKKSQPACANVVFRRGIIAAPGCKNMRNLRFCRQDRMKRHKLTTMIRLDPQEHLWMRAHATVAVMAALGDARFVGGAVRNALLGEPVEDIDIATPLLPQDVTRRLVSAGIRAIPTGLAHGTITAVADGRAFEITTLRHDVDTDGRHATVAFGADWQSDAQRRDFTINALSASEDGEVFDYTGGLEDLAARRVRFIGSPGKRIAEDALRILRLFRFSAWYGCETDAEGLEAACAARGAISHLSGERIAKEMLKLLGARDPLPVLRCMQAGGILNEIQLPRPDLERLANLISAGWRNGFTTDSLLRLAALRPAPDLPARWKLANAQRHRLEDLRELVPVTAGIPHREARRMLYRWGTALFNDRLLLGWAEDGNPVRDGAWWALLELSEFFAPPNFPLTGRDAMAAGVPAGPQVGAALREVESWWIDQDFVPGPQELIGRLGAIQASSHKPP